MKKREFIEMGLKTLTAVLAGFLAIVLMEGMIYSINLNALKTKGSSQLLNSASTIAYCIEQDEDKYFVIYYNKDSEKVWQAIRYDKDIKTNYKTKEECLAMEGSTVKEVVMHAPNAFEFSITWAHYIVMAVFMLAIGGFFTYKFIALNKSYKKLVEEYESTGTIEISNI